MLMVNSWNEEKIIEEYRLFKLIINGDWKHTENNEIFKKVLSSLSFEFFEV